MSTASLSTFFCGFFLIFAFARCCQSCHNATTDFQEMLQSLQEPERFQADGSIKLFRRTVFTKLECLDICLRTLECDSFDMKQRQSEKRKRKPWICVINRLNRRVNSESTVPDHNGKDTGWIHFPVTSQELEEVSWDAKESRSQNNSSVLFGLTVLIPSYCSTPLHAVHANNAGNKYK